MKKLDLLTILLSVLIFALFNSCSQINDSSDDFIFDLQLSEAYSNSELFPILTEINDFLKQELKDSIDAEETGVDLLDKMIQEDKAPQSVDTEFPLWSILYPSVQHDSDTLYPIPGAVLGITTPSDTSVINQYFKKSRISELLPNDIKYRYNAISETNGDYMQLFGLKASTTMTLSDSIFSCEIKEGGFYDLFSGVHREIAKIVDGESFALIIRLKSSFTNKLDGATYVINCKIDTREYLIPLDKQTLMQPIPIGILSEKEKDLLIERFPEIVID